MNTSYEEHGASLSKPCRLWNRRQRTVLTMSASQPSVTLTGLPLSTGVETAYDRTREPTQSQQTGIEGFYHTSPLTSR